MKFLFSLNKFKCSGAGLGLLGMAIVLAGCGSDNDEGGLRVLHASPNAPAVNVLVDGSEAISDLDYAESSGFLTLDADRYDISVEGIVPGGDIEVITVNGFALEEDDLTTVIAVDNVSDIRPLVVSQSAASPGSNEVAVNAVHAAPGAPEVDVYITAPGTDIAAAMPALTFEFEQTRDAGSLVVGEVQIQVALANTDTLVYDSGTVDLTPFSGASILLVAVETENDTSGASSPIKLLAVADDAVVEIIDTNTTAGAKVVHASPNAGDAAGGPVEVFATSAALGMDPVELIDALNYREIVPAADSSVAVPAATDYAFDVAPDTDTIGDSIFNVDNITLDAGSEYTVIAAGLVADTPAFSLLLTEDDNRAVITQARLKVIHAAPTAGDVDVFVTPAGDFSELTILNETPLLEDFAFGQIEGYVDVAPGDYDVRVVAGGVVAINVEGLALAGGLVANVIAIGPEQPIVEPADFRLLLTTN